MKSIQTMWNFNRLKSPLPTILFLFCLSESVDLDENFKLAPKDQIIYYGKNDQQVLQICVPPNDDDFKVEWRKGNATLQNDNRMSIFQSKNIEKYVKKPRNSVKQVNVLEIKPVLPEDQGDYTCVAVKSQKETKFRISFTENCITPLFKCTSTDETCIVNSTVCDGIMDCDDASDESINAGCMLPPPPQNLQVVATSWHQAKLTWDEVKNVISYEIRNNENESIILSSDKNIAIFEGLRSGGTYQFFIRAQSYTGKSPFSNPVNVKTKLYSKLEIPQYVDGLDFEGVGILVCWIPIHDAESYQVLVNYPDRTNKTFKVQYADFTLTKSIPDAIYSFQVRQWSGFQYSKFSDKIIVKTKPIQSTIHKPFNLTMDPNRTLSMLWKYSVTLPSKSGYRINTRLHEMAYLIVTCQVRPVYREWTTNETLISDVNILDWVNKSDNKLHKSVWWTNYTIHYDKKHKLFLYYKNYSCKTTRREQSDKLHFKIDGLIVNANYTFKILSYFGGRVIGQFAAGNFTVPEITYIKKPQVENIFHGVLTYAIACGILIVMLFLSFLIAYFCKWDKLMSDLAIKKARINNQVEQAKADKVRPLLLKGSYINDRTQPQESNKLSFAS